MKAASFTWMDIERQLARDDRVVLPLGCVEQHAYLSIATDAILAERVAFEAAEPLGIPVFPVMPYGITPGFSAYPGTLSLRVATLCSVVRDLLDALDGQGFRRVLIVNGHGGNAPIRARVLEWMGDHPRTRVRFHDWWNAPRVIAKVREIDPEASHASWMESFPWTRVEGATVPVAKKPMVDLQRLAPLPPGEARGLLGDGSFGGRYQRSDQEMAGIWQVAVEETRDLLANGW